MPERLNVIALISGGKDSLYTILHCLRNGHEVVALANLHPPPCLGRSDAISGEEDEGEDLDSYMYQTVGYSVVPLYETALGIPLYRQEICGSAIDTSRDYYYSPGTDGSTNTQDETESIHKLLRRVMDAHPEANAVCAGAVLSTYQRTRIENVALRLNLTPLAWLWMYPYLPSTEKRADVGIRDRWPVTGLLDDMAVCGCEARIIKVASGGLDRKDLWGNVTSEDGAVRRSLVKKLGRFLDAGIEAAVLGEGGEYESLALDGPPALWKKRIQIDSVESKSGEAGVASLSFKGARCVEKCSPSENSSGATLEDVRVPQMLDEEFKNLYDALIACTDRKATRPLLSNCDFKSYEGPSICSQSAGGWLNIYNITAPEAGNGPSNQMNKIKQMLEDLLSPWRMEDGEKVTANDAVFATILLRSMDDFAAINAAYSSLFTKPNPPARATVACGDTLPRGIDVIISLVFYLGPKLLRHALHVQSRSYWAPANIGPYSQAICAPARPVSGALKPVGLAFIAGQIPLVPSSMQLLSSVNETENNASLFPSQAVLSLQHMWRIGKAVGTNWWLGTVVYLSSGDNVQSKAMIAWRAWEYMNENHATEGVGEDDETSGFDVWHMRYGQQDSQPKTEVSVPSLPEFGVIHGEPVIPPFFAVTVEGLPRGSSLEWQGLGLKTGSIALESDRVDELQVIHASSPDFGSYTSVAIMAEAGVNLEASIMKAAQVSQEKLSDGMTVSYMALYTPYAVDPGTWQGQVIPCKSVYGPKGEELVAGLIFQAC